ncbi:MAG: hypothetical protein AAGA81_24415 [Acidobacteriota bacterium]
MSTVSLRSFRLLTLHALSCGLAAIVPVPFVDDLLLKRLRRGWIRDVCSSRGLELDAVGVDHVAGIRRLAGWRRVTQIAINVTLKLFFKLVRRIFRSIFFFLAIKDAADAASEAFHRGYLEETTLTGLAQRRDSGSTLNAHEPRLIAIGWAIDRACDETDTRAVQRTLKSTLKSSKALLRATSHRWSWTRRKASAEEIERDAEASAEKIVDEVARELSETGYLDTLQKRCEQLVDYWSQPEFHQRRAAPRFDVPVSS